jgi:hypothetical protein
MALNPESEKYLRNAEENMLSGNNPFDRLTDNSAEKLANILATQAAIIKYAEAMAQVLAQAALASHKATGDPPHIALHKWTDIIRRRASELIREGQSAGSEDVQKAIAGSGSVPDKP